ncbi:chemotaxis protein CheW [Leptolyngbya cf. ectocarpi LEGE 11479]|uniref:Chemotaxis protein CheW n=1 Tax=Leptolyngbya cf. ectocarpi LEGE 11479 TaxID=1828722 RepID=A0A929F6T6_LEPEC|nr:CheW domain-containing protein [Leptolyngbya ectocarpi]MBE9067836.1 chemotaxis protein CheW [Leptolyngbya cf. ectocarpi LEGE 11479]
MQLSASVTPQSSPTTQFLKFNLLSDMTALLPVDQLAAVLKIETTQVTPIPHLPPWVMGVYNWRGEVLWIVDTGHLLESFPWQQQIAQPAHYNILLLEQTSVETGEQQHLGLLVRQVEGIELLPLGEIQSPTAVSDSLVPFLRGYWLNAAGDMLTLLDGSAIFDRMPT